MTPQTHAPAGGGRAPLAVDLFCGLGGWTDGLLAEGWRVRGYDIEAHEYDGERYPGELIIRDILDMHGSEIADADLIVSSSPCTEFAYRAMPWKRAKALTPDEVGLRAPTWWNLPQDKMRPYELDLWIEWRRHYPRPPPTLGLALFDAQFRLQREASEAAGRYIPMVVENVRGAQPWVGRAKWSFGSYFLWGDVPALMPVQKYHQRQKVRAGEQWNVNRPNFTGTLGWDEGLKNPGFRFDGSGRSFQSESVDRHLKAPGGAHIRTGAVSTARLTNPAEGRKGGGDWFGAGADCSLQRRASSGSKARKTASAKIAKIPFALSSHIARVYRPLECAA